MELKRQVVGDILEIAVQSERIDAASAIKFKDEMRAAVEGPQERVLLNLSLVDFIDSSGLGAIVSAMKQLGAGRRLELAGLTPKVEKVFRLTRMDSIFRIHDTPDAALATSGMA